MEKVLTTNSNFHGEENWILDWEQMQVLEQKGSAGPNITGMELFSASELHLALLKMKAKPPTGLETPELWTQEGGSSLQSRTGARANLWTGAFSCSGRFRHTSL